MFWPKSRQWGHPSNYPPLVQLVLRAPLRRGDARPAPDSAEFFLSTAATPPYCSSATGKQAYAVQQKHTVEP